MEEMTNNDEIVQNADTEPKTSRQQAQVILDEVTEKLHNKEIVLDNDSALKVALPEDKIICVFNAKNGIQMLGFVSEKHFNDFADKNLTGKNIIEYKQ